MEYRHISYGVDAAIKQIQDRKDGKMKSLKTSFNKLNKALMNGVD
jgi:hypothetical protein